MTDKTAFFDARIRPPFKEFLKLPRYDTSLKQGLVSYETPPRSVAERSMEALFEEMDEVNISRGLVMGRHTVTNAWIPNESVAEFRGEYKDRFWVFGGVGENKPSENLQEAKRCIEELGLDGIALDPGWLNPPRKADDRYFYPVYAYCETEGISVSVSMSINSGPDLSFSDPVAIQRITMDFPKLRLVVSHAGWPMITAMLAVAAKHPNVWLLPDLYMNSAGLPGRGELIEAANHPILKKKIIFGSAYPSKGIEESVNAVLELPLSEESQSLVFHGNLLDFLKEG